ncbi:hypothetical protein ACFWAN_46160 [Streptomyces mirabilis]|uniref:nSTAND1 domain-containing NTPase n=1 Tax=Streptomyces mirabilis TaxID=68239 RepID=UPI003660118F
MRKLRAEAGSPTYRMMARRAGQGASTLSQAAAGERLPTLPVVLAYVRACGGDEEEWGERWRQAAEEVAAEPRAEEEDAEPPYRGLARFEPTDASLFFGRDELIERLFQQTCSSRFTAVFGPSGSGKSSLLRAGLISRLRTPGLAGPQLAALRVLTPGEHPLLVHAQRLVPADGDGDTWLILDQFEELYTLCTDPGERDQFIDCLLAACDPVSRLRVVIAVRADFLGRCAAHPRLTAVLQDATVLAGPMSSDEQREAIVKPAQRAGLIVERSLTARILDEVANEPGGLPLMSHALLETWQRRQGRALTVAAYEASGGLRGAITRSAEGVYARLTPAQTVLARRILLRLVTPGEGTPDTRRPAPRAELDFDNPADTAIVLDRLVRARLLTLDHETVDLAHEALITGWPRLREWIDEAREELWTHRQLTEAARVWKQLGGDPGTLYRSTRLASAAQLPPSCLSTDEQEFLDASLAARLAEEAAVRRRTRLRHQAAALLSILSVLATVTAVYALHAQRSADRQRAVAQSRELAARSEATLPRLPETAMMLALKGYRTAPTVEARGSLLSSYAKYTANQMTGHTAGVQAVAFSPDGRTLATAGIDHSIKLWDTLTHQLTATLTGHTDVVNAVAFSPDGRTLATASADHSIKVWDTSTQREIATLIGHDNTVNAVAFSPDGHILATGSSDGTIRLWDTATWRTTSVLDEDTGAILTVSFSPDGIYLATAGLDRRVRLWSTASWHVTSTLTGCKDAVRAVAFSPSGHTVVAAGDDGTARLWSVTAPRPLAVLGQYGDSVAAAVFSPDGHTLATAAGLDGVRLWDVRTRREIGSLAATSTAVAFSPDGHTLATADAYAADAPGTKLWNAATRRQTATLGDTATGDRIAFSPDGRTLATTFTDGTVLLWDLSRRRQAAVWRAGLNAVWGVAFSPDGRTLATGAYDHTVRLWDTATHRQTAVLTGHTTTVLSVAFSPDGRTLATGAYDGTVRLWDVTERRSIAVLRGHTDAVNAVAFSSDGRTLATASSDRTVRLWNAAERRSIAVLRGHTDAVNAVAFSSDGRTLATASSDRTVRLWNAAERRSIAVLRGHTDIVSGVSFTPDGHTLITSSYDRTVRLWQIDTARTTAVLDGDNDSIDATALSPDGRTLATTGGAIGDRRLWSLDPIWTAGRICQADRTHHWAHLLTDPPATPASC